MQNNKGTQTTQELNMSIITDSEEDQDSDSDREEGDEELDEDEISKLNKIGELQLILKRLRELKQ